MGLKSDFDGELTSVVDDAAGSLFVGAVDALRVKEVVDEDRTVINVTLGNYYTIAEKIHTNAKITSRMRKLPQES
jgi:hypothetical protein